jgi:hypothetical protein
MCHFDMKEELTFSEKMNCCIKNGLKVYPVFIKGQTDIIIEYNGKKKNVGIQSRTANEIADEMIIQYTKYYKFLKGLEKCK